MDTITFSCRKIHQVNMQDEMQMRISRMDHGVMNSLFSFEVGILFLFGCGRPYLLAFYFVFSVYCAHHASCNKEE
jgi:hypothetical protein